MTARQSLRPELRHLLERLGASPDESAEIRFQKTLVLIFAGALSYYSTQT